MTSNGFIFQEDEVQHHSEFSKHTLVGVIGTLQNQVHNVEACLSEVDGLHRQQVNVELFYQNNLHISHTYNRAYEICTEYILF